MSDWEQSSVRDVFDAWRQGVQVGVVVGVVVCCITGIGFSD